MTTLHTAGAYAKLANGDVTVPLSVVVAGNSESVMVVPARTRRTDGTYGEQLVPLLEAAGVPAAVRHAGQWFSTIADLRHRYEHEIRNHFPDVLVLQYGIVEAQPNVVPTWLARNVQSWDRSSHPIAIAYHEHLAGRIWKRLREVQRRASEANWPTYRISPARFEREMRRMITMARDDIGCLVLVLDIDHFGARARHWLPGAYARREQYQAILRRVSDEFDDNVRFVDHSSTLKGPQLDEHKPDGIHRNAVGHRLTAEVLCGEVLRWLERS